MSFLATWMDLQIIRVNIVSQEEKDTIWYHIYVESQIEETRATVHRLQSEYSKSERERYHMISHLRGISDRRNKNYSPTDPRVKNIITRANHTITRITAFCDTMKLRAMPCRATQDGRVTVERVLTTRSPLE